MQTILPVTFAMRVIMISIAIPISLLGCSISGLPVETLNQRNALPNTHTFSLPIQKVRSILLQGLQLVPERDDPFYRKYGFVDKVSLLGEETSFVAFYAEEKGAAIFGESFFTDLANAGDIYVHSMGIPVISSYYRNADGHLSYSVKFAISLNSVGENGTKVTIRSFDTSIGHGKVFNVHAFGYVPKSVSVAPVRAEEYKLLVYVAHLLGTELPPLDDIESVHN